MSVLYEVPPHVAVVPEYVFQPVKIGFVDKAIAMHFKTIINNKNFIVLFFKINAGKQSRT